MENVVYQTTSYFQQELFTNTPNETKLQESVLTENAFYPSDFEKIQAYNRNKLIDRDVTTLVETDIAKEVRYLIEKGNENPSSAISIVAWMWNLTPETVTYLYETRCVEAFYTYKYSSVADLKNQDAITQLYSDGCSLIQSASILGISIPSLIQEVGALQQKKLIPNQLQPEELVIMELREEGATIEDIATLLNWSRSAACKRISYLIEAGVIESKRKNVEVNEAFFDTNTMTPELAYFLGLFITDGHLDTNTGAVRIVLKHGRSECAILKDLHELVGGSYTETPHATHPTVRLVITRKKIANILSGFGIDGTKDYTASIPEGFISPDSPSFEQYSKHLPHLVRGLYDGDGTQAGEYGDRQAKTAFTTASPKLAAQVSQVLTDLGITHSLYSTEAVTNNGKMCAGYQISIGVSNLYRLYKYLYPSSFQMFANHELALQRKKNALFTFMRTPSEIMEMEYKGRGEAPIARTIRLGYELNIQKRLFTARNAKKINARYTQLTFPNMV